ncbi:hypothetical protein T03_7169 [Trichinella britovi]|uniref:Uncharacterized protein n=1 Tax=Trichinella britovi TaxID=45882 RepID=A0A0V1C558_TRIBR|nr:hypothetical protein T03_14012 [Trichinella britovi]KRY44415.1 hypothetical protein T03_7169 [Trichinella britovi]KRZ81496.1 hypothetical protein T08_16294 [Trichinella sp. T8]KRZ86273.1 hypothetical protein T08_15370 [Trichinella sp. T8]KRZ89821.1 hypothetical protein T08_8971 [Trichinella sp. T8]
MVILEEIWRMSNCAGSCSNHTCGWDIQIVRRFNKTAFSLCKFVAFVDTIRGSKKIVQNKLVTGSIAPDLVSGSGRLICHMAIIIVHRKSIC